MNISMKGGFIRRNKMKKCCKSVLILFFVFEAIISCKTKTENKYNLNEWAQQPLFINPEDLSPKCGKNILEFYKKINEIYNKCNRNSDCSFSNETCHFGCHVIYNNKFKNEFENNVANLNNCLPKKCLIYPKCRQNIKENLKCINNKCVFCEKDSCFYDYNRESKVVQKIRKSWNKKF